MLFLAYLIPKMENSIIKGQKFDSFDEIERLFKTYCNQTHQNYLKRSSRFLRSKMSEMDSWRERFKKNKIIFKDIIYDCFDKVQFKKNPVGPFFTRKISKTIVEKSNKSNGQINPK